MMKKGGLICTILVITAGIVDLCFVAFGGVGSSFSNFLINAGFKAPFVAFTFGFVMGHLFGYMSPAPLPKVLTMQWSSTRGAKPPEK